MNFVMIMTTVFIGMCGYAGHAWSKQGGGRGWTLVGYTFLGVVVACCIYFFVSFVCGCHLPAREKPWWSRWADFSSDKAKHLLLLAVTIGYMQLTSASFQAFERGEEVPMKVDISCEQSYDQRDCTFGEPELHFLGTRKFPFCIPCTPASVSCDFWRCISGP